MWDRRRLSNFCKPRRKQSGYSPAHTTSTLELLKASNTIKLSPSFCFSYLTNRMLQSDTGNVVYTFAQLNQMAQQQSCRKDTNLLSSPDSWSPDWRNTVFPPLVTGFHDKFISDIQTYFIRHCHLKLSVINLDTYM